MLIQTTYSRWSTEWVSIETTKNKISMARTDKVNRVMDNSVPFGQHSMLVFVGKEKHCVQAFSIQEARSQVENLLASSRRNYKPTSISRVPVMA